LHNRQELAIMQLITGKYTANGLELNFIGLLPPKKSGPIWSSGMDPGNNCVILGITGEFSG
jgi:hypothetical protein